MDETITATNIAKPSIQAICLFLLFFAVESSITIERKAQKIKIFKVKSLRVAQSISQKANYMEKIIKNEFKNNLKQIKK